MNKSSLNTMLHDYVQGKLSAEEVKIVKKHIQNNPQLIDEIEEIKSYYNTLKLLEPVKAPEDFLEKVHGKINGNVPLIKKIISARWLKAEFMGLAFSVLLVVIIINPFKYKDAPTITYDEVPRPNITNEVQKEAIVETKKYVDETPKKKSKPKPSQLKIKTIKKRSKARKKVDFTKLDTINAQRMEMTASKSAPSPTLSMKYKDSHKIIEDKEMHRELESLKEMEDLKVADEVPSATPILLNKKQKSELRYDVDPVEKVKGAAYNESMADFAIEEQEKISVKQEKKRDRKGAKKRDRDSNKIGSYLEPREKKARELREKLKKLEQVKQEEQKAIKSNAYESEYDTIEKIEKVKDVSKDDITFMIRKNLNTYKNTVLIIDHKDKIFMITMQSKDFDSFKYWLSIKFNDDFKISDDTTKKDKITFKLEF